MIIYSYCVSNVIRKRLGLKTEEQIRKARQTAFKKRGECKDERIAEFYHERLKCFKWILDDNWPEWMYTT